MWRNECNNIHFFSLSLCSSSVASSRLWLLNNSRIENASISGYHRWDPATGSVRDQSSKSLHEPLMSPFLHKVQFTWAVYNYTRWQFFKLRCFSILLSFLKEFSGIVLRFLEVHSKLFRWWLSFVVSCCCAVHAASVVLRSGVFDEAYLWLMVFSCVCFLSRFKWVCQVFVGFFSPCFLRTRLSDRVFCCRYFLGLSVLLLFSFLNYFKPHCTAL